MWRGGKLPDCYRVLGVVDDGRILEDSPLLSRVLGELKRRAGTHESLRGRDLQEHFDRPPYGWDERVVRLAIASLFRSGSIEIRTAQGTFRSSTDSQAARALTNRPTFKEASFHPAQVLTNEQRREVAGLVAEWFSTESESPDEIDHALRQGLTAAEQDAMRLATRLTDFRLGGVEVLRSLAARAHEVLGLASPTLRLLAVLDSTVSEQVGSALSLLRRLKEWEHVGGFERTAEIQAFMATTSLEQASADRIQALLAGEDLPRVWPDLYQTYQAALASHAESYGKAHSEITRRIAALVAGLQADADEAGVEVDLTHLETLGCHDSSPVANARPFHCSTCQRSLSDLQRDLLAANELRSAILRRLHSKRLERQAPAEGLPSFEAKAKVRASDEIEPLTAQLEAYAERVLKDRPIEIEIRARPGTEGR